MPRKSLTADVVLRDLEVQEPKGKGLLDSSLHKGKPPCLLFVHMRCRLLLETSGFGQYIHSLPYTYTKAVS